MDWWVTSALERGPIFLGSWVFWVIFSICLHELAHGYAAIWQGDDTPRVSGHMTMNPLVHMGGLSLLVFALLGIAWGAMPVNPSNFRSRYGDAAVAAAGPLTNGLLMVLCVVVAVAWQLWGGSIPDPVNSNVLVFLEMGAWLNAVLMLFNLLPVPPLDGGRILGDFVPAFARLWQTEKGAIAGILIFALLFFYSGNVIFGVARRIVGEVERSVMNSLRSPTSAVP